jgi:hypothetical protein
VETARDETDDAAVDAAGTQALSAASAAERVTEQGANAPTGQTPATSLEPVEDAVKQIIIDCRAQA